MWYLACCDDNGKCFGFLRDDGTVSENPDSEMESLMCFKKKSDANAKIMQINLGKSLIQNESGFRVVLIKG